MGTNIKNKEDSIFFNQQFDKKRLKALISWVFKQSGEAEALKVVDLLKETGFRYATKAGISIGLHDLTTPIQKSWLISESQLAMNTTDRDFIGARITATERSQRIIDTWHRASESLSKQVVDYFGIYDRFNPVYIMALSGARGNFSQVRQLIGMRGLMADQQGKIVNFPIRSNLREGLTLTEYFISCSGARKGLVDTALRTADTGYLTRRLVDVSHHVVVKRIRCNTNRGIAFKSLQSYNKVLLALKERLVGRVLAEDILFENEKNTLCKPSTQTEQSIKVVKTRCDSSYRYKIPHKSSHCKKLSEKIIAKKDQEISLKLSLKIAKIRDNVYLRSPLTCGFTSSVCQLCYGWSISQGSLVSLGDAVGVIAAQSIGEPGTQLTMRTFHTGGVFSGDLLQEIRAPHAGKISFSKAFQGLLIRTAHGRIAFLSKTQGSLLLSNDRNSKSPTKAFKETRNLKETKTNRFTTISIPAFTMLFVRQGEKVENNQLLAEFSIRTKEGNQPIKTQQTIFAELSGKVVEDCSGKVYTKSIKESAVLLDFLHGHSSYLTYRAKLDVPKRAYVTQGIFSFSSYSGYISAKKRNDKSTFVPQNQVFGNGLPYKTSSTGHTNLVTNRRFGVVTGGKGFAALRARPILPITSQRGIWVRRRFVLLLLRRVLARTNPPVPPKGGYGLRVHTYKSPICKRSFATRASMRFVTASAFVSMGKVMHVRARLMRVRAKPGFVSPKRLQIGDLYRLLTRKRTKNNFNSVLSKVKLFKSSEVENLQRGIADAQNGCKKKESWMRVLTNRRFVTPSVLAMHSKNNLSSQIKNLNIRNGVQNEVLQKTSDTKLALPTMHGKRFFFLTKLKERSSSLCKIQILSSSVNEDLETDAFKYIEPVKSGRLGFLKILAIRAGATFNYMCPIKSSDTFFVKTTSYKSSCWKQSFLSSFVQSLPPSCKPFCNYKSKKAFNCTGTAFVRGGNTYKSSHLQISDLYAIQIGDL